MLDQAGRARRHAPGRRRARRPSAARGLVGKPLSLACFCTRPNARSNSAVTSSTGTSTASLRRVAFTSSMFTCPFSSPEPSDSTSHCERGTRTPNPLRGQILSLVRLPVPPLSHFANPKTYAARASLSSAATSWKCPLNHPPRGISRWTPTGNRERILVAGH